MALEDKDKKSLLSQWKSKKKSTSNGLALRPENVAGVPSQGQERLWLLQQLFPNNVFYQYAHRYKIKGKLDLEILDRCFTLLINRQEIFRTNFVEEQEKLLLKFSSPSAFSCKYIDLRSSVVESQVVVLDQIIKVESCKVFDLATDRLIRAAVIHLGKEEYEMVLSIHHIIGDRWSLQLLNSEIFDYYSKLISGIEPEISQLPIQYADYAYWQRQTKIRKEDLVYWQSKLAGDLPILKMPADHKRPIKPTFAGALTRLKLDESLSQKIRNVAKDNGVTMFVLLLSIYKIFIYRYTGQEDLIIGSPFSNRDQKALEKIFGFFNETIVLRSTIDKNSTFIETLKEVRNVYLSAFQHKDVPFDLLVRSLDVERQASTNPIFQTMFLYNSSSPFAFPNLDLEIEEEMIDLGVSKFDLTLFVQDQSAELTLEMEYATDLFDKETVNRMLRSLEVLVRQVIEYPNFKISELEVVSSDELDLMLNRWNHTNIDTKQYSCIHDLIEQQIEKNSDNKAISFAGRSITYKQLGDKANSIAFTLQSNGIQKNDVVGLFVDRSLDFGIGMLGILKAGAAYLPLDPEYPKERIDFMIGDSGAKLILCQEKHKRSVSNSVFKMMSISEAERTVVPKKWVRPKTTNVDLAYIIFTSGSTGNPKGVPINHGNLLHSTHARFEFYPSAPSAFLLLSSFSFDSSIAGIFWTLCSGGNLIISPNRIEQDVELLASVISSNHVSHTLMLPSLYNAILSSESASHLKSLRNIMVAGEACPFSLIAKHYGLLPETELYNEYGPTEASVWCLAHKISKTEKGFVPIGKPIPNAQAYIMNSAGKLCPIGVAGELHIGGKGVAAGYLNSPELTAERFINHPYYDSQKLYKTGDLACQYSDGRIEFLGRVDNQVKIRGYRVEPEEIENKIKEYQNVEDAVVVVHQSKADERKSLIAYVTGISEVEHMILQDDLVKRLPSYMIPTKTILLKTFNRLPNGKINRKSLPDPEGYLETKSRIYEEPQSEIEILIAKIWQQVIGVEKVGLHDNFFSLGGDSILSIQVVSKARDAGLILLANQIFDHQTVFELAASIKNNALFENTPDKGISIINPLSEYELSTMQKAFLFNSEQDGEDSGMLLLEFTIGGVINTEIFEKSWQLASNQHDVMRTFIGRGQGVSTSQIVADTVSQTVVVFDWTSKSDEEQKLALFDLKLEQKRDGLDLRSTPVSRVFLIRIQDDRSLILWVCHHIFLDGWSCGVILRDVLEYYNTLQSDKDVIIDPKPTFYLI